MVENRHSRGVLISFEGSEGSGKTTQIRRLAKRLRKRGFAVTLLREPGGTALGERIRHLLKFSKHSLEMAPETELLLFAASRAQLVREKVIPALFRGEIILCDRFIDSTVVYQGVARGLDLGWIRQLNRFATGGRRPDLTFLLLGALAKGLQRARKKTKRPDRMESQKRAFYRAVDRGFQVLAKREPRRIKIIPSEGTISQIADKIGAEVDRWLVLKAVEPRKK